MLDFMADRLIESLEEKWEFMKGRDSIFQKPMF
jgi:hypothetical protein